MSARDSYRDLVKAPHPSQYYQRCTPKPGAFFWSSLVNLDGDFEASKNRIEKLLCFDIPDTLLIDNNRLISLRHLHGKLTVSDEVGIETILANRDLADDTQPMYVHKQQCGDATRCRALDQNAFICMFRAGLTSNESVVFQKYCRLDKLSSRATILRVFYSSKSKPTAYCVSNTYSPTECVSSNNDLKLTEQFCVSNESTNSDCLSVIKVRTFEDQLAITESVFRAIQRFFRIRLSDIVVDLVGNKVIQIKSFTVDPTQRVIERHVKNLTTCRICAIARPCPRTVSGRMVAKCHASLRSRNIDLIACPCADTIRCCDVCYSLILNERELNRLYQQLLRKTCSSNVKVSNKLPQGKPPNVRLLLGTSHACNVSLLSGEVVLKFLTSGSYYILDLSVNRDCDAIITNANGRGIVTNIFSRSAGMYSCFLGKDEKISLLIGNQERKKSDPKIQPLPDLWIPLIKSLTS